MADEITTVDSTEVENVRVAGDDIVVAAEALVVESTADCERASLIVAGGTALLTTIDGLFQKPTKKAHEAHKSIKGLWNEMRNPVAVAVTSAKKKVGAYHDQLERDAEAARRLEAERLRKVEEDRRLAAAVAAEDRGQPEKAEEIIEAPPAPTAKPLIITPPPPKVAGLSKQKVYSGRVVDLPAFIQWSLDTLSFSEYFTLKQSVLDRAISKRKGDVTIPGVEVQTETQMKSKKV